MKQSYHVLDKENNKIEKTYTRTKRNDKIDLVGIILNNLLAEKSKYLLHRKIVDVDSMCWKPYMSNQNAKLTIHMDFSMNIALTNKKECQSAHFGGKQ